MIIIKSFYGKHPLVWTAVLLLSYYCGSWGGGLPNDDFENPF